MSIRYDERTKAFLLNTPSSTYIIRIFEDRYLLHGGWIKRTDSYSAAFTYPMVDRSNAPVPLDFHGKYNFSLDSQCLEYPFAGHGDFRSPAMEVLSKDGTIACDAFYSGYKITKGKKSIPGLPHTWVNDEEEADTLEIDLRDKVSGLLITLVYTVFNKKDVITRSVVLKNDGNDLLKVKKLLSASIDFLGSRYKMLTLNGSWGRECHPVIRKLVPGMQTVGSRRNASSNQTNPFMALMDYEATETSGTVYGFSFVYSGSFTAGAEVDQFNVSRVQIGLNPYDFNWNLKSGKCFSSPEVVMVYSDKGLGEMSRTYHDIYRNNLCRGKWAHEERPVVINNWEATYFDFTEEKLLNLADTASRLGIELFVLDDGWFGSRTDDLRSLGDWYINKNKLPHGLKGLADKIHQKGMKFGLWFEPEMISQDSDLYRSHPDWALHIDGRYLSVSRHQLMLDLSRSDVVDYLIETLSSIFDSNPIDYVKWDFNRNLCEISSSILPADEQQSVGFRYYLGLYRLMETLTQKYSNILFESCASGGGRFDPGMFYYMNQAWTSDDTDAISRVLIQMGAGIVYPPSGMSCHVSAVPNHQVGRINSLSQRADCAMAGTFGYELDLNKLTAEEQEQIKKQVSFYKKIRSTVQYGDIYRIRTLWQETENAEIEEFGIWENVSKDKKQAVLTVIWTKNEANPNLHAVKWQGLEPKSIYELSGSNGINAKATGEELMNLGIYIGSYPALGGSLMVLAQKI